MNTYRKTYTDNVTFTANGTIETPRNRVSMGDSLFSKVTDFLFNAGLLAVAIGLALFIIAHL